VPALLYGVLFIGYSVYMDRRGGDAVNHSAHLCGAVYGLMFVILADDRVLPRFLRLLVSPEG